MARIGELNQLVVLRETTPGFYLDGGTHGDILLPGCYRTPEIEEGVTIEVFVYRDSEDRLVATTELPYAVVGQFAFLRVVSVHPRMGAFLDWGLEKDLLLPNREWTATVRKGDWVVVFVRLDLLTDRVVATARVERHLDLTAPNYQQGQAVKLLVAAESPLGYKAIIEQAHSGLLYHSSDDEGISVGQTLDGFIQEVRPDGKIDLSLHQSGYERIGPLSKKILAMLATAGGRLPYHDKTPPTEIQAMFGVSKKAFKQAIGGLFRDQRIVIEKDGIRAVKAKARK